MVLNKAGREIPQEYADQYGVYEGELARIKPYEAASRKSNLLNLVKKNY